MSAYPDRDTILFYRFARDWLHTYLPVIRRASPKTVRAYQIALENFIVFLGRQGVARDRVSFECFSRDHVKAWIVWMTDQQQYAPRTIGLRLSALKAFIAYAGAEDLTLAVFSQALAGVRLPASPKAPIRYLAPEHTRAILRAHDGHTLKSRRNRALLILLYETGARVSEITQLTLGDLNLVEGQVMLTGKRNKTRVVPLGDTTVAHVRVYLEEFHPGYQYLASNRPLFYSLHGGVPVSLSVDSVASILAVAAGIARGVEPSIPGRVHCHLLRKTRAMDLYQDGIPLPIIMRLLGHENMTTTNTFYAFATVEMMRAAIQAATPTATQPLTPEVVMALTSLG